MRRSISIYVLALVCIVLASCATTKPQTSEADKLAEKALAWAADLEKKRRVNDNWSADCTTDNVTQMRRCFAATFGQNMDVNGQPYGPKNIPFQVYFFNESGPYLMVGYHTYPGRTPIVRIDDNEPVRVHNDAGVTAPRPDPQLVRNLLTGKVVRARYHVWPDGSRELYVDLKGFVKAWQRLSQIRNE